MAKKKVEFHHWCIQSGYFTDCKEKKIEWFKTGEADERHTDTEAWTAKHHAWEALVGSI